MSFWVVWCLLGAEVVSVRLRVWVLLLFGVLAWAWLVVGGEVVVSYLGHSCFTLEWDDGPIVMIDPYGSYVPYPGLPAPADIVLMTHQHIDHCPYCFGEVDRVEGDPILVHLWDEAGRCREKLPPAAWVITPEFRTHAIEGTHVTRTGGGQGWVCMFSFEVEGIGFAHLGDLGRPLSEEQIDALSDVDVLFVPVGGAFTLDAAEALTVIAQLPSVKVVFPTHYYVAGITPWSDMAPLDAFTDAAEGTYTIRTLGDNAVTLDAGTLPRSPEIWILEFEAD